LVDVILKSFMAKPARAGIDSAYRAVSPSDPRPSGLGY
jgi:hypothetical protein